MLITVSDIDPEQKDPMSGIALLLAEQTQALLSKIDQAQNKIANIATVQGNR